MYTKRLLQLLSRSVVAFAFLLSLAGVQNVFAQTIFVSSTTGSDAFDGLTATISGGSGPKATLAVAYATATAGSTISIEAGAYAEAFAFAAAKGVTIEVRPAGAVLVATFAGTSTIAVGAANTITLNSGAGSIAVAGGAFTLTSGTINLGAGYLNFTVATALTVTAGTATGATPGYTGAVTAVYTLPAAGSAGTEIPASLNVGGSLTVAGAFNTTFGSALTAPLGVAITNTATTTFSGAVTVSGGAGVVHTGNDVSFASISLANGVVSTSGLAGQTLSVSGGVTAAQTAGPANPFLLNGALSAMTVTGAVLVTQSANAPLASGVTNGTGTLSMGSLTVTADIPGVAGDAGNDIHTFAIINGGTLSVTGAVADNSDTDADETDSSVISLANNAGGSTFTGDFNIAGAITANAAGASITYGTTSGVTGAVTSAGLITYGGNGSIGGIVNNTGGAAPNVFALGANTLTLSGAGPHVALGKVTGATGTVSVTGASNVPTLNTDGHLNISGNGDIVAAVVVGGNLTMSGTNGDVNTAGSFDVAGNATFSGTHTFTTGAATNDIDGSATFSGAVTLAAGGAGNAIIGSGSVTATGSLTIPAGATLTVNGDFNTSLGGAFAANPANNSAADNATLAFVLPQGASATYTPGPNTSVDDFTVALAAGATAATLTMGQSVAVDENFTTAAGTTVNLGQFLIRHSGNTAAALIGGLVTTPAGQAGALAFEGTTNTLTGLGDISNILVNVGAGNRLSVLAGTSVDFTGELTLFTGGVTVAVGSDISPQGSLAEVRRNAAAAAATTDIVGVGTFNGDAQTYILSVFGAGAVTAASEFAATGITTLNIEDTATYTTNKAATVGNINTEVGATLILAEAFNVTATGVVANAGTMDGTAGGANEVLILTGDSQAHTNTGNMGPGGIGFTLSAQSSGATLTGTATLAAAAQAASINNLIVGDGAAGTGTESITMTLVQQINGTITVASDGTTSIGLVQDDATAGTGNGDEGSVDGAITVANGGSLTWTSDAIADAAVTVGTAPVGTVPTFDFNGNIVHMSGAFAFAGVSNANFGATGSLELDAAGSVGTNLDGALAPTSVLPGLRVDAAATISSATRVTGTTDVNATWGSAGLSLTVSGKVNLGGGFVTTANMTIIGTNVDVEGAHTLTGALVVNATSVDFNGATAGADVLTVTGAYTHTAGTVTQTNATLTIGGLFTQTAGAYTLSGGDLNLGAGAVYVAGAFGAAAATDEVRFTGGGINTSGGTWSVPNMDFDSAVVIDGAAGTAQDVLTVGNRLEVSAALTAGNGSGAATPTGVINLGDGAGTFLLLANGGNVIDAGADGTVNYGVDVTTVNYSPGTAVTLAELPTTFDTLIMNTPVTFADARAIQVNNLDLNAGPSSIDDNDDGDNSVTVVAGGTVNVGVNAPFGPGLSVVTETFTPAAVADFNLIFDAGATASAAQSWAAAWTPDVTVTPAGVAGAVPGTNFALHATNLNACDFSVAAGDRVDLAGFNLNVLCDLNTNTSPQALIDNTGGGSLSFAGTTAQTLTGGLWLNTVVTVNNAAGLTLSGGNLNTSDNATNAVCVLVATNPLTLTAGIVTTGTNRVIMCHTNTTFQGFTRTGGSILGNVQVTVDGTDNAPAVNNTTDRVEFPLGDDSGNYRPFALTFNTPTQLASDPVLVATYNGVTPAGTNGLPIATTDIGSNAFSVGRYPSFHWAITSVPSVTPSIDYDVEFRAAGYANFVNEDIERTRAIRRADGDTDNFWILASPAPADNDNFAASATEPVAVGRSAVGQISGDGVLFTFGLESNLSTVTANTDLVLNAGNAEVVALIPLFTGGGETQTYAVTGADAAVLTTGIVGSTLTVTGVAAGTNVFTVTVTDEFGDSSTSTVSVTVNAVLAEDTAIADYARNAGDAADVWDGAAAFTGGTTPYAFGVVSGTPATATATVDAATGAVTVTPLAAGTSLITVTATDAELDAVPSTFTITVNAVIGVATAIADKTFTEGDAASTDDVSTAFAGGTGTATYTASSDDTDVATVGMATSTLTTTAGSPYDLSGGSVVDAADATVTVTATDALGGTVSTTFAVTVNPKLGDLDGSGGPSAFSASLALDAFLGLGDALTAKQTIAADYDVDADIDPFDAYQIWQAASPKRDVEALPAATLAWGEASRTTNTVILPIMVDGNISQAVSASLSALINPAMATVKSVTTDLGEGWMVRYTVDEDGLLRIGIVGIGDLSSDGTIANVELQLVDPGAQFNISGSGAINNNPISNLDEVEVVQLPETFALDGNYPNPFNPTTTIQFDLPETADVEIQIYDMLGRRVMVLPITTIQAGSSRTMQLDASSLASGSYFYRVIAKMDSKTVVENGRMLLIK